MSQNKEIKFSFVVDERSAQQAKRVIRDLIADAEKLAKTLSGANLGGVGGGGGGGGLVSGSVGGPQSNQAMVNKVQGAPAANKGLAQVFLDNSNALKGLASVSTSSMRIMSDGIKRAVDEQKRSLSDLDSQLDKLTKRYNNLAQVKRDAIAGGGFTPEQAEGLYGPNGRFAGEIQAEMVQKMTARQKANDNFQKLSEQQRQMAIQRDPYSAMGGPDDDGDGGGGGFGSKYGKSWFGRKFPLRTPDGRLFRAGAMGAAIVGGVVAGAGELQAQNFDYISNEARQANAFGTLGVSTKNGDLRYAAAMMQVMRDPTKRAEFLNVGDSTISAGISEGAGALGSVVTQGPGGLIRAGMMNLDSAMKEKLRSYMDQQITSDPDFYSKLDRFQGESGQRISMMRRMGYSEGKLSDMLKSYGEDAGAVGGAFEATRGGSRSFAQHAMGLTLRAMHGGMDMGAAGDLLSTGAMTGNSAQLLNAVTSNLDPVASERFAQAISGAMKSSSFGPVDGMGLAGAFAYGMGGNPISDAYAAQQRGAALPALAGFLGGSSDGLGTAINVLSANNIVGPGGDLYKVNALAQLAGDPAALYAAMQGKIAPGLEAMGVTSDDAKSMFSESMGRNIRARFVDQGPVKNPTAATQAMQKLATKYNGDVRAFMEGETLAGGNQDKLLSQLGAGLNMIMPQTIGTTEQGKAVAAMLAGAGDVGNPFGKGPGDSAYNSTARTYEREKQKSSETEFKDFLNTQAPFIKQLSQDMREVGNMFSRISKMDTSAEQASKSLMYLAAAADGLTQKFGGVTPERGEAVHAGDLTKERMELQAKKEAAKAMANDPGVQRLLKIYNKNPKAVSPGGIGQLKAAGLIN